jgi:FkbM family methyltransferase
MGEKEALNAPTLDEVNTTGTLSDWRQRLRTVVVKRGIKLVCGTPDFVPTSAASDVSIISGGLRLGWLRALGLIGVSQFAATSGLGHRFVCHIGDLSEYPFYHPRAYEKELALCASWLKQTDAPVVYDLGANVGFISTHLAQMLAGEVAQIYAFEPVPATFAKLQTSVSRLGLQDVVRPIPFALGDNPRTVRMALSRRNSLVSHVIPDRSVGDADAAAIVSAQSTTLDQFSSETGTQPALIKMDIEGSEAAALRGARHLLSRDDRPAILFEHNPVTLSEQGATTRALAELLSGYEFYYVDDLQNQTLPFGSRVADIGRINWICNMFAVPRGDAAHAKWRAALALAQGQLGLAAAAGSSQSRG